MGHLPKIHVTSTGKKYFNVNDRRIYIASGVTRKQILSIYKTLKKAIKPKKTRNINKYAQTIVNINNAPSRRSYQPRKFVKLNSMMNPLNSIMNPLNRSSVSNSNAPANSALEDKLNSLINKQNKLEAVQSIQLQAPVLPVPLPGVARGPPLLPIAHRKQSSRLPIAHKKQSSQLPIAHKSTQESSSSESPETDIVYILVI